MSMFKEIPVTAGHPLKMRDIVSSFNSQNKPFLLEEDFRDYLGAACARVTYSGTAALYLILEAMKKMTRKRTVIIPSYTCPLVGLAAKRAGFRIEVCDITGYDFNYNIGELEAICGVNDDIAAVLAIHLAGIPLEFDMIHRMAERYKLYVIEDCALSLGASYKDNKLGSLGDFSFFSLARGKGPTMYEGGVAVSNREECRSFIHNAASRIIKKSFFSEGLKVLQLFGYGIFYRPSLFWFAYRLPEIFWRAQRRPLKASMEEYDINFSTHEVSDIRKRMGHSMFLRLDQEIKNQREKALYYIEGLKYTKGIRILTEPTYGKASYPYVVLLFSDAAKFKRAKTLLCGAGLGVSDMYSLPVNEYDFLKPGLPKKKFTNADYIAHNNMTLSTSPFLTKHDADMVLTLLKDA